MTVSSYRIGSDGWFRDVEEATALFKITVDQTTPCRFVRAEADTGSNYEVVVTELGKAGEWFAGAPLLVSVLQPWQTCYAVQRDGHLHWNYVTEKFLRPGADRHLVHGGDLAAITLAVGHALGRPVVMPEREEEKVDGD